MEITKNWGAFHTSRKRKGNPSASNRRTSRPPEPYKTEHECFKPVFLLRYAETRCCGIFISKPTIGRVPDRPIRSRSVSGGEALFRNGRWRGWPRDAHQAVLSWLKMYIEQFLKFSRTEKQPPQ